MLLMAGLAFGAGQAEAGGYCLRLVENKHDQTVLLLDSTRVPTVPEILEAGQSVHLRPGATYGLGFSGADMDALDAECPFLRVSLRAECKDLDVEIPFDYVQLHDRPDAQIEQVLSPVAYADWFSYLKLNNINIYILSTLGWQALPGLTGSLGAAAQVDPDGPAPMAEERKEVARTSGSVHATQSN